MRNWVVYEADGRREWLYRTPRRGAEVAPRPSDLPLSRLTGRGGRARRRDAAVQAEAVWSGHARQQAPDAYITLDTHESWDARVQSRVIRLAAVDLFVPSLEELAVLTGSQGRSGLHAELPPRGPGRVQSRVRGALRAWTRVRRAGPAMQVTVADSTGAGEAFCGGLAAGLARGLSLVESVALGGAMAGTAITSVGSLRLLDGARPADAVAAGRRLAAGVAFVDVAGRPGPQGELVGGTAAQSGPEAAGAAPI